MVVNVCGVSSSGYPDKNLLTLNWSMTFYVQAPSEVSDRMRTLLKVKCKSLKLKGGDNITCYYKFKFRVLVVNK